VFVCPNCGGSLHHSDQGAQCENGHAFDRAKEGYLNLLVAGRLPASTTAGDTAESLTARRRFLSSGMYAPIADALANVIDNTNDVLDIGCGEGYYLSQVSSQKKYGLDISKRAVQMTSRLLPDAECVVASAYRIPVADQSCTTVMSVFSPHSMDEIMRVLHPSGRWFTVTPGPFHLKEMRPHSDDKIHEREQRRLQPPPQAKNAERIQFTLELTDEAAYDLYTMTPLQWQASAQSAVEHVRTVSVDVWLATS